MTLTSTPSQAQLRELLASCPPSAEPLCKLLLDASAEVLVYAPLVVLPAGGTWSYRMLMAVSWLQHLPNPKTPVGCLAPCGYGMEKRELCETVATLGNLLLAQEVEVRGSRSRSTSVQHWAILAQPVLGMVQHAGWRLQKQRDDCSTGKVQHGGKKQQRR